MDKQELKNKLSDMSYYVTQENGTEPPFDNEFDNFFEEGLYVDIVSGKPLFTSLDKYNSGCGWPAFTKPVDGSVKYEEDHSFGMERVEVRSTDANSHLGHVFKDGPLEQGGLRYCINSASLKFIPVSDLKKEGYEEFLKTFEEI